MSEQTAEHVLEIPVRTGRFAYVRVRADGEARDLSVDAAARERGSFAATVAPGDVIIEIAVGSTSDPDLDPARGQLWPVEADERRA